MEETNVSAAAGEDAASNGDGGEDAARAAHAASMPFPIGEPNDSTHFIGQSYRTKLDGGVADVLCVTCEPGCRHDWHIHHADAGGGQILVCVAGRGYYQVWGEDPVEMNPGDCASFPAGTRHWHGAAPDSWFTHLVIMPKAENPHNEWFGPVTDEEYSQLR